MTKRPSFQRLRLIPVHRVRCHEEILPNRIAQVIKQIENEEIVDYPILLDSKYHVILDGHHRFTALKEMGVERIPAVEVDYFRDDLVKLETRKNCPKKHLSKQDVLRMGLSPDVFPPKSTRHTLRDPLVPENVPLHELFDPSSD